MYFMEVKRLQVWHAARPKPIGFCYAAQACPANPIGWLTNPVGFIDDFVLEHWHDKTYKRLQQSFSGWVTL